MRFKRKIKHFPGIVLSLLLLILLAYLLGWSSLLSVRMIEIEGTSRIREIQNHVTADNSHLAIGSPLARVDVHAVQRQIESLDWVDSEKIGRDWMHGRINIQIVERIPIAQFVDSSGELQVIDKTGIVFRGNGKTQYPVITFSSYNPDVLQSAAHFIQNLPSDLLNNMDALALRSPEFIQSKHKNLGNGELILRWGNTDEMSVKTKVLRALLALPENAKAKLIDLSSPLSPIVK